MVEEEDVKKRNGAQAGLNKEGKRMDNQGSGLEGKDSSRQRGRAHQSLMGSVFGAALAGIGEQIARLYCKSRAS